MKLLQMGKGVYQKYRETVKGNQHTTYPQAQKKLTRNVKLASAINPGKFEDRQLYGYGSLQILVAGNKIVWIKNKCRIVKGWEKDTNEYERLNKALGITEAEDMEKAV